MVGAAVLLAVTTARTRQGRSPGRLVT
jgi:hypothetical protein